MSTDHDRVGGLAWTRRTGGALSAAERRRLLRPILVGQLEGVVSRLATLTGRRPASGPELPVPPDSAMAREAEEAAATQSGPLLEHGHRTWIFGRAFAAIDGEAVDDELFYVAALLHDYGLMRAVTGEDFTLRSAVVAGAIAERHTDHGWADDLRDAICSHATPGTTVSSDGPESFYVQKGALCDLGGLRVHHLSAAFVDEVFDRHPREGLRADILGRIAAEAEAVPAGRFAHLQRFGFRAAIRLAPF